jgi:hypothetical protein
MYELIASFKLSSDFFPEYGLIESSTAGKRAGVQFKALVEL